MRESIGGAFTLEIIIIFMVLVNSYLAFSVNYSKAFKVKNAIIDLIENNEGFPTGEAVNCTTNGDPNTFSGRFCKIIRDYGYTASKQYVANDKSCSEVPHAPNLEDLGICIIPHTNIIGQESSKDQYQGVYYTVYTYINIELPILKNILQNMPGVFRISGDTNIIYSSGGNVYVGQS